MQINLVPPSSWSVNGGDVGR